MQQFLLSAVKNFSVNTKAGFARTLLVLAMITGFNANIFAEANYVYHEAQSIIPVAEVIIM